mmetsp:Transcript_93260/g.251754  ORF Transcript_93260/g.251754 Transcript_93260/m.251754 type:complete len:204 (-) Transcript_93260:569-1180(-)
MAVFFFEAVLPGCEGADSTFMPSAGLMVPAAPGDAGAAATTGTAAGLPRQTAKRVRGKQSKRAISSKRSRSQTNSTPSRVTAAARPQAKHASVSLALAAGKGRVARQLPRCLEQKPPPLKPRSQMRTVLSSAELSARLRVTSETRVLIDPVWPSKGPSRSTKPADKQSSRTQMRIVRSAAPVSTTPQSKSAQIADSLSEWPSK